VAFGNCHCGRKLACLSIVPPWDIWGCPNDCKPGSASSCDDDWETQEVQDPTPNFATIKVVKSGWGPVYNGTFPTGSPVPCVYCGALVAAGSKVCTVCIQAQP